jgi:hypothetical protein
MNLKAIVIVSGLLLCFLGAPLDAQTPDGDITVQAEGFGISKKDALLKAKRNAVENGIGTILISQGIKPIGKHTTLSATAAYGDLAEFDPLIEEIRQMREANNPRWKTNYNYGLQTTSKRAKRKVAAIAQNAYESAAAISREIDYKAMMYYKIAKVSMDLSHNVILADQYKQKAMSIAPDSEAAMLAGSL